MRCVKNVLVNFKPLIILNLNLNSFSYNKNEIYNLSILQDTQWLPPTPDTVPTHTAPACPTPPTLLTLATPTPPACPPPLTQHTLATPTLATPHTPATPATPTPESTAGLTLTLAHTATADPSSTEHLFKADLHIHSFLQIPKFVMSK